jgi:glucose/arabinose dehydrogenase
MKRVALYLCFFLFIFSVGANAASLNMERIRLPEGFGIEVYAGDLPGARSLALSPSGTLFVGTRRQGAVYAVTDADGDRRAERKFVIARGLNSPNGVALRGGDLYVAEIQRVIRFADIESRLSSPGPAEVVNDDFPDRDWHGWKFIRFGPDGKLYVPVGAPCNVCLEDDPRFAAILRMDPDGRNLEIFARGVRNTVGFDWHPETGELWFTDNGRDWLGDDQPPDELNRAPARGLHFGFPYVHGTDVADPVFGQRVRTVKIEPPVQELGPHVAALGMRFYTGKTFPSAYRGRIFIAEHGSWNRSEPIGYRITQVRLEGNRAVDYTVFADGWLSGDEPWGRPVDVEVAGDGSLLVSDDYAGVVYRIYYRE